MRRRRSAVAAVLDTAELVKVNCSDNSSKKRFWLYRFVRAFAVVIGLLLLAALPLSVAVLLLAVLPLVLAALDPDNPHRLIEGTVNRPLLRCQRAFNLLFDILTRYKN
jgi:predicted cobalt transporter CbtA